MSEKTNKKYSFTKSLKKSMEHYLNSLQKESESTKLLSSKLYIFENKGSLDRVKTFISNKTNMFSFDKLIYLNNLKEELLSYVRAIEGINSNLILSNIGKKLLLTQIVEKLRENSEKESYVKKLINITKFISDVAKLITELKSIYYKTHYNKEHKTFDVDKLEEIVFSQIHNNNVVSKNKYKDIAQVIRKYEEKKKELKLIDKEDTIIQTIHYLSSTNKKIKLNNLEVSGIIIPAMFTMSIFDIDLLSTLSSNLSCELHITLFDCETNLYLREYLNHLGFVEKPLGNPKESSPITKLTNELFNDESSNTPNILTNDEINYLPKNIKLIENSTRENEVNTIAKIIKEKLREEKDLNPDEIMIILPDLNNYKSYLKHTFKNFGVDIFISEGEDLFNSKLIYTLLNVLELKLYGFRYSDFIKLIKSNYVYIREEGKYTRNYTTIIENFFRERRIDEKYFDKQIEEYINKRRKNTEHKNSNRYLNELEEALIYIRKVRKIFDSNDSDNDTTYKLPKPNVKHNFYDIVKA